MSRILDLSKTLKLVGMAVALLLAGCVVGPDCRMPEVSVPAAWHSEMKGGLKSLSPEAAQLDPIEALRHE